jgi:lipoate-protein ligase A
MAVIPSGVEESLDTSEGARDVSTSLDMTTRLFAALDVYSDDSAASAALNMAIDEALLENATVPSIRFYRWQSPALSFGYFGRFSDVAAFASARDLVRRWTGGGIVFHGNDLTYSIMIPGNDAAFAESSMSIYEKVHHSLRRVLIADGERAELAAETTSNPPSQGYGAAGVQRPAYSAEPTPPKRLRRPEAMAAKAGTLNAQLADNKSCFANPVRSDVMIDGRKIAGAAQRRTRRGLLQQGSIQGVELESKFAERFLQALSPNCSERDIDSRILNRACELAERKYATDAWLRKR